MPAAEAPNPYAALNAFFDRILVVSLRRATERHARLPERLRGLRYEMLWGTDKADLDLATLEADGTYSEARARIAGALASLGCGDVRVSRPDRLLYDAVLVIRAGSDLVLVVGDAEEDHRRDAEGMDLRAFAHDVLNGHLLHSRHRRNVPLHVLSRNDEQRIDQVVHR